MKTNNDMKVALCLIAKNENCYIREWVDHYYNLGIDKIYIYDNNDEDGEKFDDVISDYINNGFVKVINYRDKKFAIMKAYKECYENFNEFYDWIAFFDTDEFLTFADNSIKNIKTFLSDEKFSDAQGVCINWKLYDDNGHVYQQLIPVKQRFTNPKEPFNILMPHGVPYNAHVKVILRGGLKNIEWTPDNPHTLIKENHNIKYVNPIGETNVAWQSIWKINYDVCWLNHYSYKTIQEYIRKIKRGDGISKEHQIADLKLNTFFRYNELTNDKIDFILNNV